MKHRKNNNEPLLEHKLKDILNLVDIYTIGILTFYLILSIALFPKIVDAKMYILTNSFIIASIITLATIVEKFKAGYLIRLTRYIYIVPLIFFIYSQTQIYISILNPNDFDWLLIKWDNIIFGTNPNVFLSQFANPWLTEFLQFSYMTFFIMPLILGFEIFIKRDINTYLSFARIITFGFFVSYLLYFFLPAIGPRFTLFDFNAINLELPGVYFTDLMRELVNIGGGIRNAIPLPPADAVNRDCMPSGHTMITIINMWQAHKYKTKFRWWIYFFGVSLIIATVYLRYHYVVDVIAGVIFAIVVLWVEPKIRNLFKKLGFRLV